MAVFFALSPPPGIMLDRHPVYVILKTHNLDQQGFSFKQEDKMKNTIKFLALLFGFLLLAQSVYPEEERPFTQRFSLKLTWGFGSNIPIGDVNTCLESFNNNEIFEMHRKYETGQVAGEIKTLDDRISHWEAELRFDLTPRISFGIATSAPFHKHNQSSVTYTVIGYAGPQIMTWTFKPNIKVSYPIRLSAHYTSPLILRLRISVSGGFGIYTARISQLLRFDEITPIGKSSWYTWDQEAKRNFALGFHGNISLEYFFTNRLALVAEFQQRYIKISSLKGKVKHENSHGDNYEKNGTLYYFTTWDHLIGARYSTLEIWPEIPEDPVRLIDDVRKAVLDLSGHSFRLGIRIRLF